MLEDYSFVQQISDNKSKYPRTLLLYSYHKIGKSEILSQLANKKKDSSIILDWEDGYQYVTSDGNIIRFWDNEKSKWVNGLSRLETMINDGVRFNFLIVDGLTGYGEFSSRLVIDKYNKRKYSTWSTTKPRISDIGDLGHGIGYGYQREEYAKLMNLCEKLSKYVIYVAHVKDSDLESGDGSTVKTKNFALSGQLRQIIPSKVDAIGYLFRKKGELFVSFQPPDEDIRSGSRVPFLEGRIIQLTNNKIADWSLIYGNEI